MKKRKIGFLTSVAAAALWLGGIFLLAAEFLPSLIMNHLPRLQSAAMWLMNVRSVLVPAISLHGNGEGMALLSPAVFMIAMGFLLVIYRRRKPYSLLFWAYLWFVYSTVTVFLQLGAGVVAPWGFRALTADKLIWGRILLALEVFLGFILMYVTGSLDQKWRARVELREESEAAKGEGEESVSSDEKPLSMRQVKKEEKRKLREQKKREEIQARERAKAEKAEALEEEKRREEEEREERLAQKSLDRAEAKEERREAKRRAKEEKKAARKRARDREEEDESGSFSTSAPDCGIPEPARSMDEKLSFPEVRDIPRLETIEHSQDLDKVAPDPQEEFRRSFGLMNTLKEEVEREEHQAPVRPQPQVSKWNGSDDDDEDEFRVERQPEERHPSFDDGMDRYRSGSMVEATLESIKEVNTDVDRKSLHLNPIIGLDEDRTAEPSCGQGASSSSTYSGSSIAPSTLSKNHPRYRMFESLARPPQEDRSQIGIPTTTTGAPSQDRNEDEHFAPSTLSKDHPRYKLFESLRRDNPSSTNVSHMPGMPFKAEETPAVKPASYDSTFVRERDQQESLSAKMSRERMESISSDNPYLNQGAEQQAMQDPQGWNQLPPRSQMPPQQNPGYGQIPPQQQGWNGQNPQQWQQQNWNDRQQMPRQGQMNNDWNQQPPQGGWNQPAPQQDWNQPAQAQMPPRQPVQAQQEEKRTYNPSMDDPMASWQPPRTEQRMPEPGQQNPMVGIPAAPMRAEDIESIDEKHKGKYDDTPAPTKEQENEFYYSIGISGLSSQDSGMFGVRQREMMSYTPPTRDILVDYPTADREIDYLTRERGEAITSCFEKFKIHVTLDNIIKGPTVTMYEIKLGEGIPVSKVKNHNEDIMYALGIRSVRILAPVPGKQAIGIEVPNTRRATIGFKDMLYAFDADESSKKMAVPMILGRTVTGEPVSIDVAKTPHLLIAGSTGSGKSVGINSLIATILYNKSPRDVRLIMVDPKVVELKIYNGIPHLLTPVITEAKKVKAVLAWLTEEMDRRYEMLSRFNVRNIVAFNDKLRQKKIAAERLPYIVLIMDEYADLMTTIGKDIEYYVGRLTAMARAVGIHLVLATQRPDADVVTGIIKANIPSRIAFAVGSGVNSRIILDEQGAEQLLGKGDLLYKTPSSLETTRIQGAFLSDGEVEEIVAQVKRNGEPDYLDESIFEDPDEAGGDEPDEWEYDIDPDEDEYEQAKSIVYERKCASASYLQRRMKIGYNKAARFVERMEEEGIIGPPNGSKPRELIKML